MCIYIFFKISYRVVSRQRDGCRFGSPNRRCCGVHDLGPSCKNAWSAATCVPKSYARLTAVGEFVCQSKAIDDILRLGMLWWWWWWWWWWWQIENPWYGIFGNEMVCVCVLAWKFRVHQVHAQTSPVKKRHCRSLLLLEDPNSLMARAWGGIFQKSGSSRTCGQQNGGMQRICTYIYKYILIYYIYSFF